MATEVQRWFDRLPQHWQERAQRIRELLLDAAPGIEEKWLFKSTPFYLHHGWMCYLNFKQDQLIVGFCNGVHMLDPQGLFALTDHKLIRHYMPAAPPVRLNEAAFRRLLEEAVLVNEAIAAERKAKRRKR
jgi:hypothetical protein